MSQYPITSTHLSRALDLVTQQHAGDTVLSLTFGREVALDRAYRFLLSMARHALPDQAIDDFAITSYWIPGTWDLPANVIAFMAPWDSGIYPGDIVESEDPDLSLLPVRWCILDWRVANPERIVPSTMITVYPDHPIRREQDLARTDMLPLWFRQSNGTLGVPIISNDFDCLPDTITRIRATTLKVVVHVSSPIRRCRRLLISNLFSGPTMAPINDRLHCP
ncbi:hypothetical protein PENSPDRAFT_100042 [Peniophora sp. CONT]|nr:hypothetical protein PENSPDRAFT_100042 [Peniophora sp. CONT]